MKIQTGPDAFIAKSESLENLENAERRALEDELTNERQISTQSEDYVETQLKKIEQLSKVTSPGCETCDFEDVGKC